MAGVRLYTDNFATGRMLLANQCTARDETTSSNSSYEVIEFTNLVKEFESGRALAGDDLFIIEG